MLSIFSSKLFITNHAIISSTKRTAGNYLGILLYEAVSMGRAVSCHSYIRPLEPATEGAGGCPERYVYLILILVKKVQIKL